MNSQSKVNLNGDGRGGAASEVAFEEVLGGLKAAQERRAHHNVDACPFLRHLLQHIGSAWPGRVTSLRSCHILASFATRESQQEKRTRAFCQGKKKEKGVKEKSVKEKGVKEKGVKEKGVKEKGVLLTASASGLLTASAWRKWRRLAKTPSRGTKRQHTEKGNANENEREPALEREDDMQKNVRTNTNTNMKMNMQMNMQRTSPTCRACWQPFSVMGASYGLSALFCKPKGLVE